MGITRAGDNGKGLTSPRSGLWLADDGFRPRGVRRTPRIGIRKATTEKLRYILAGSECVSS
jgi:3-methyladenine DNA glycosylase Mpg